MARSRIEVARFIEYQMHVGCHVHPKKGNSYGWQEFKLLMDYIYGPLPHEDTPENLAKHLDIHNERGIGIGTPDPRGGLTRPRASATLESQGAEYLKFP